MVRNIACITFIYLIFNCRRIFQDSDNVAIYFNANAESAVLLHLAFIGNKRIQNLFDNKLQLVCFRQEMIPPVEEEFFKRTVES